VGLRRKIGDWSTSFWNKENPLTVESSTCAILFATIQCRIALWIGNWFASVKR